MKCSVTSFGVGSVALLDGSPAKKPHGHGDQQLDHVSYLIHRYLLMRAPRHFFWLWIKAFSTFEFTYKSVLLPKTRIARTNAGPGR